MSRVKFNYKLFFLIFVFFTSFFILQRLFADESKYVEFPTLGNENAPVKIKIFSSLTCPHCASFHTEIVPKIVKEYVNSGKVRLIFLDFPLDLAALNASKLLNCLSSDKQIKFLDDLYKYQKSWTNGSNIEKINDNLKKIVKNYGINNNNFNKCLKDETVEDHILKVRIDAQTEYSINATPTIIINEKKFEKTVNFKNIKKEIEKLI